jgi:hypothetical protein
MAENLPGINEIIVQEEKMLRINDALGWDKARSMAIDNKVKALGMFSQLLFRPKAEDISIIYEEKRYQAFWHVIGVSNVEYLRKGKYKIPVEASVRTVEIAGNRYDVKEADKAFEVEGIEHCSETHREELQIDAQTEKPGNFASYLHFGSSEITSTDDLTHDGAVIVNVQSKASYLVRKVLNELVKPVKADEVLNEQISIEIIDLYFYSVYAFEYLWAAKDKKAFVEFDGATGETRKGQKVTDRLRQSFSGDDVFDFAKEIAGFVPGGGLAMVAGKKAYQIARKKMDSTSK